MGMNDSDQDALIMASHAVYDSVIGGPCAPFMLPEKLRSTLPGNAASRSMYTQSSPVRIDIALDQLAWLHLLQFSLLLI